MRDMKNSGVEWIGEIPTHWSVSKVGMFYNVVLGKMLQPEQNKASDTYENYLCAANLGNNTLKYDILKQMWFSEKDRQQYEVQKGDLIVVEGGDVASCDIVRNEVNNLYIQNALHRVRAKMDFSLEFLRYSLMMAKAQGYISLICNKATIAHFTKDKFMSLPFLVAPIDEQLKIVQVLDEKCGQVNTLIANVQRQIERLKAYKQSVITEVVTKGLDSTVPMKNSGVEWIGEIPEHWSIVSLGGITTEIRNGYVGPTRDLFFDTGVRYIQSLHTKDGAIDFDKHPYYVSEEWANEHPKIHTGDVLIVQTGDIGQVALVNPDFDGCNCHALIIATPNTEVIDPAYLTFYLLSHTGKELMLSFKTGALLPHLNSGKIKSTPVCVPDLETQRNIVDFLNTKVRLTDRLIAIKHAKISKLEQYKRSLIYEYVTGKKEVL